MRVLFFDGHCSLCNNFVDWMIRRDRRAQLKFASLQGETARQHLPSERISEADPETIIYLRGGKIFERSTAVLLSLRDLGAPWSVLAVLLIVPRFIRDFFYRLIARHRYRLFGRRETCRIPTPEERERLLP